MKSKFWLRAFLITLITALGVLITGNLIYFYQQTPGQLLNALARALENSLLTVLGGPLESPVQLCQTAFAGSGSPWEKTAAVLTAVSSLVILGIHVCILVKFANLLLHFLPDWNWKQYRVLVIGSRTHCHSLLNQIDPGMHVYYWSQELMDDEALKELLRHRISAEYRPYVTLDSEKEVLSAQRFLNRHRISYVVLADDSDAKNMQMYLTLSGCAYCQKHPVQFHALCSNWENQAVLENYFDSELRRKIEAPMPKDYDPHMDLQIFSIPQIQAERMFNTLPLHSGIREDLQVRLLILGGGSVGQAVLLQAMNRAVLTSSNSIRIDVVDRAPQEAADALARHFSRSYVEREGNSFRISSQNADGDLQIRFHGYALRSMALAEFLRTAQQGPEPYTYVAVCLPNPDDNLYCSYLFEQVFGENIGSVALAFRMSQSPIMQAHLQNLPWCGQVIFLGTGEEYIGLSQVVDIPEEQRIRKYNHMYSLITSGMYRSPCADPETLWNRLLYFKRESNRALYHHQSARKYMCGLQTAQDPAGTDKQWKLFIEDYVSSQEDPQKTYSRWLISRNRDGSLRFPDLVEAAMTEHRRFCYNMASRGWGHVPDPEKLTQKVHACLVPWQVLEQENSDKLIYDLISAPWLLREAETRLAGKTEK